MFQEGGYWRSRPSSISMAVVFEVFKGALVWEASLRMKILVDTAGWDMCVLACPRP